MGIRCDPCANLSIEHLVDLAKEEFSGHCFPTSAYYQHHASFGDLEQSANAGCDLCQLIIDCFKGIHWGKGGGFDFTLEAWEGPDCDIEASAYAAAKELGVSDVKLCINADHVYLDDPLDKVRVFNTILVQVGPQESTDEYLFSFLPLALSIPSNEAVQIQGFRIGRHQVHPDLGAPANFDIARGWLDECRTVHGACLHNKTPELPTRVIDTGTADAPITPRVFLSRGARADYIALSHCWGGSIATLLNAQTYAEYQKALPFSELPANFQDALRISKELGIRYVWIDSLCIIQDSKDDWLTESKKMGGIYRNATLTISALVSEKSTAGILRANQVRPRGIPQATGLRVFKDEDRFDQVQVGWKLLGDESLRGLVIHGALARRAWTLQEFILSPRNLLYGDRQIYWRCPGLMKSADSTPEGNQFPDYAFQTASQVIYSDILAAKPDTPLDIEALLKDYYQLAEEYSGRNLTYGSDKLPAFSGIARSLRPVLGGDYLAGLWTSDFKRGLLWRPDLNSCKHAERHGVPSWSWMVTDEPVLFSMKTAQPNSRDMRLLRHKIVPRDPTDPFGHIDLARVVVKGLTIPLIRSTQVARANRRQDLMFGYATYDEPLSDGDRDGRNSIVRMSDEASNHCFVSIYTETGSEDIEVDSTFFGEQDLLVLLVQVGEDVDEEKGNSFGEGLALRQVPDQPGDTYERIGHVTLYRPRMSSWETRVLDLI